MTMIQQVVVSKILNITLYLCAFSIMLITYIEFINPLYDYMNFDWNPNLLRIVESIFIIIIISALLPSNVSRPSDFFIHLHFLFPILPMIMLYGAENQPREFLYFVVLCFIVVVQILKNVKLRPVRAANIYAPTLSKYLLIISWMTIAIIVALGGMRYFNLSLFDVYKYRTAAAENLPSIFSYILPLVSKVALPFSLLISVHYKNKGVAWLAIFGSVMIFGLTSHKGPLIYPLIILALYFVLSRKNPIKLLIIGYILTLILSHISFLVEGLEMIGSMIVRRSYLTPAELNYLYFEFFSSPGNNFYYWSDSRISAGLLETPSDLKGANLIGLEYFNNENTSANTGWIGAGFMHAGYVGMMLYAIILSFIFTIINSYSSVVGIKLIVPLLTTSILTAMVSSDLLVTLLTHGLMYCLILISLIKPDKPK
jgi:hypothetical protein